MLRDHQAQSCAAVATAHARVDLREGLEQLRLLAWVDTDSAIAHAKLKYVSLARLDGDHHFAAIGELHGVADEIGEDLPQPIGVGSH